MSLELSSLLDEDDVKAIPSTRLKKYAGSPEFYADLEAFNSSEALGFFSCQHFNHPVGVSSQRVV
jgi:hypothetical protein